MDENIYIVPKEDLPRGIKYRAVIGKPQKKPEKTVYIQKILTLLEGTKGKRH